MGKLDPREPHRAARVGAFERDLWEPFVRLLYTYPRRSAWLPAWRAYRKVAPDNETLGLMLDAIAAQSATRQWRQGFVPHLSTWLNQRRWEDESEEAPCSEEVRNLMSHGSSRAEAEELARQRKKQRTDLLSKGRHRE